MCAKLKAERITLELLGQTGSMPVSKGKLYDLPAIWVDGTLGAARLAFKGVSLVDRWEVAQGFQTLPDRMQMLGIACFDVKGVPQEVVQRAGPALQLANGERPEINGNDRPKRYGVWIGVAPVRSCADRLALPLVVRVREACLGILSVFLIPVLPTVTLTPRPLLTP